MSLGVRDDVQTFSAELKRIAGVIAADPEEQERFEFALEAVALWRRRLPEDKALPKAA